MSSPAPDTTAAIQQAVYLLASGELGKLSSDEIRTKLYDLLPLLEPPEPTQPPTAAAVEPAPPPAEPKEAHAAKHPKRRPWNHGK